MMMGDRCDAALRHLQQCDHQGREVWLKKHLSLPSVIPSHDTLGRLLGALKPTAFQRCFEAWIQSIAPLPESHQTNQIAIDGKVLRRSHDRRNGLGPPSLAFSAASTATGATVSSRY